MSLIPSHSTLVTAFTLLPSPLSFFLFFLLTLPTCEINHKLHPAVRMSRSKKLAAPWARTGAGIAAPISVSWRRSLGLVLPRCAPLSTLDPTLAQPPSALPRDWAESAISQRLPTLLVAPVLCLISCSALLGWETGIWQEGVNSQFNWVFRTKAAVAALSFWSWLTNRQFENRFLPSARSSISQCSQVSVSLNMGKANTEKKGAFSVCEGFCTGFYPLPWFILCLEELPDWDCPAFSPHPS